ncbi:MAG: hypothetical protein LC126_23350 [Bryobacterales bacterium]|nr:hypothetical protein [Bryobacterales bacterium]
MNLPVGLAVALASLSCVTPVSARELSNDDVRDISHTIGFCFAQTISLEQIERKFPTLATAAAAAKFEFEGSFGAAVAAMNKALEDLDPAKWEGTKQQMSKFLNEKLNRPALTEAQARDFIATVRQRAKGGIEQRALQPLLIWDPHHRSHPASEFAKYKKKFVANGEGKSKGIKLQIEYPESWAPLEAERPNIVRKFVSERGRGFESAMVSVKSIPPGDQLSKREIDEAFSVAGARELVPPGGTFISGKRISFDGLPGVMVTFRLEGDRMGQQIGTWRFLMYMTFFRGKVISVQFSTRDDDATSARFDPLFRWGR